MSHASATRVLSTDGTEIAYELHGDGPGVILIDGAMCFRDSGPMRPLCTQLDDDFTVLLYDRRGRGASTDATSTDRASTDAANTDAATAQAEKRRGPAGSRYAAMAVT